MATIGIRPDDAAVTGDGLIAASARAFAAYQEGDEQAMADLVRLLTPILWHTARGQCDDRATAEEAVQQSWLALVDRRDTIRDPQAVLGWLLTTVRRTVWASRRGRDRRRGPSLDDIVEPADPTADPLQQTLTRDADRRLWSAVAGLTPRCRHLLRVIAFADRPDYHEIAVALGMPVGSIGPTRGRCLAKLREAMTDPNGGSDARP